MFAFHRRRNGPRRLVLRPRGSMKCLFIKARHCGGLAEHALPSQKQPSFLQASWVCCCLQCSWAKAGTVNARPTVRVRMEITVFMVLFLCAWGGKSGCCVAEVVSNRGGTSPSVM